MHYYNDDDDNKIISIILYIYIYYDIINISGYLTDLGWWQFGCAILTINR